MKKKILIIDDDEAILHATKLILELQGYEVNADTTAGCLDDLKKTKPDLILLDVLLSGEDGRDICKKLKLQKETKHIPVILFSANTRAIVEKNQKEIRHDGFIEKPFEIDHLLKTIDRHINTKQISN